MNTSVALYQKALSEQANYQQWLLNQPPEEILHHAYEYSTREDILMALEDIEDDEARVLLSVPDALSRIYNRFEKLESSHMEEIRLAISEVMRNG